MEKVHKSSCSWPNLTMQLLLSIPIFGVYISFFALIVCGTIINFYTCIDDRNPVMAICYLFHLIQWESGLIDSEILIIYHIINIRPYIIQWQSIIFVSLDNILQIAYILVPPSTLMCTQRPKWWYSRSSQIQMEFIHSSFRRLLSQEKSEINYSSNNFISQIMFVIFGFLDNIHRIGTPQIIHMEISISFSL